MSSTLRCLATLELLAEAPFELTLADLAEKLEAPKPTAHRLCATLLDAGLIEQDPRTRRYRLAAKALWVGSGYLRHSAIYRAAFFPMQELARRAPGTVQLGVLQGDRVLFIHSVGYADAPHAFADVGLRRPLYATASGKVLLAAMPPAEAERMLAGRYEKFTEQTITTPARMRRELDEVRRKQYARNIEELLPGYWVLAGRVRGAGGATLAAISLTLSIEHLEKGSEARYAAMVRDACQKASLQLGFRAGEAV
jgi:DNA-binding IclR family transcriptional regulator